MATITQKEKDGSTTLKYVPDVPGPGEPTVPVPPAGANPPPAGSGGNAAGQQGSWQTGTDGINRFVPAGTPISRTVDTPADTAQTFLDTFQQPETAAQIAERKRKGALDLIDSTNKLYDTELVSTKEAGQKRLDQNNAINVLSGLMGSSEAVRTDREVSSANQKELDAVNAKRAVALQTIYSKISESADAEALQQKEDATRSAEGIVARRKQSQTDAVNNLTLMAKSGAVDFDAFKNSPQNAKVYQYALDAVGGSEDALRGLFATNRPQDQLVGTPVRVGDHFVQAYKNPLSGKVSYDTITVPGGLPAEYNNFQKMGDNLVAIPDGWDGDTSKLKTIAGSPSTMERLQQQSLELDIQKKQAELTASQPDTTKAGAAITLMNNALKDAKELSGASGRSGARRTAEAWLVGSTEYTDLVAATNTIKTNILTLATDPTIKKFFGPQMSNADVTLMTSAGTTLNPELQSPEKMKAELTRLSDLMARMQKSVPGSSSTGTSGSWGDDTSLASQVAGKGYDYDAMKADGHSDDEIRAAVGL